MRRIDALEAIYPLIEACVVVTIMGATATATGSDLVGIARAAGISRATQSDDPSAFHEAVAAALGSEELSCIVAKVDAIGPKSFHMDVSLLENRFEFRRYFRNLDRQVSDGGESV